ncbi:hypothetical protein E2C04_06845 [Nocardioides daphniae]|uniref:Uncharacterized protein n=1 Tax=Nocardioides daphniae TaxID=402297 RepID=A0A4V1CWW2_9ACTN|nr:hypothetical protein E2C04_06845 [Nocardioides daphniae]
MLAGLALVLALWWFQPGGEPDSSSRPTPGASAPSSGLPTGPSTFGPVQPGAGEDEDGLPTVRAAELPREARRVLDLIDAGGPFAHPDKDGSRFGNFEGRLPARPRGYYREYTVPTPGIDHRGARRIVTGQAGQRYWTADHYESFARILR